LRPRGEGRNSPGANLAQQRGETGGGASADDNDQFERLGVFVNGNIDFGSKSKTANEDGFDFGTTGITAGIDYRFAEGLVFGFALGYANTNADIDANGGDLGISAWSSTLYGTYYATEHFYLEGSATYGWGSYDQTRNIRYSLLGNSREAAANFDGNQYALMFGAGYDFVRRTGIIDLYGRVRYIKADLDGYRENGALGLDLNIAGQQATSFMSILGVNYTGAISMKRVVLVPQVWCEWAHEFQGGDESINGVFANDPSDIAFVLATDKFDSDYFRLGVGLGAQFGKGRTAFINYEAAIGMNNYTEQTVNLGVRLDL
jgi:outer membrane autotransporter protein